MSEDLRQPDYRTNPETSATSTGNMSTPIKSTDYAALNRAFAEMVAGCKLVIPPQCAFYTYWQRGDEKLEELPNFCTSLDATVVALPKEWHWQITSTEARVRNPMNAVGHGNYGVPVSVALVIAALRAVGVEVEDAT